MRADQRPEEVAPSGFAAMARVLADEAPPRGDQGRRLADDV
jgi:hypothetical protein